MKTKLIQLFQRWGTTILSPSLNQLRYENQVLAKRVAETRERLEFQQMLMSELSFSVLFQRWSEKPFSIISRAELGYWLNFHGLYGEGVEVGVLRGAFSELLLKTWQGRKLHSIDPWIEFDSNEYPDDCNVSNSEQEKNFELTTNRLAEFGNRSSIIRKTSQEAADLFADASLDFVYIDAQHHYEAAREDIALWAPKVKPGGILGGHDYLDGDLPAGRFGVKRAVNEWGGQYGYPVIVTKEGPYPSWFVVKPK